MTIQAGQATNAGSLYGDIRLNDFSGGLVDVPQVLGPAMLNLNQSPLVQNVDLSGGSIRKMKGFSKVTTTPVSGDISSLWYDVASNTTFVAYGNSLGRINGTGITQLTGATGYTNNAAWVVDRLEDWLFFCNGTDAPQRWNPATATLSGVTTPPATWGLSNRPRLVKTWQGRLFSVASGDPDILYYSKLWDSDNWAPGTAANAGGAIRIGADRSPIRAIYPLAEGLLIFKDPGLYFLAGTATYNTGTNANEFDQTSFEWTLISEEISCAGPNSLVVVDDALYVWGRGRVWMLRGTDVLQRIQTTCISEAVAYRVGQVTQQLSNICAVNYPERNQIWFSVAKDAGSTTIDTVYVYTYSRVADENPQQAPIGAWSVRTGYAHKCMANVRDSNGRVQIYTGGYDGNGCVFLQNNTSNYDGAAMDCLFQSAWIPLGAASKGRLSKVAVMLGPDTNVPLSYAYAYDFQNGFYDSILLEGETFSSVWNTTGSATWGTSLGGTTGTYTAGNPVIVQTNLFGSGRRVQHRFSCNLLNSDFDVLEIVHPVTSTGYA